MRAERMWSRARRELGQEELLLTYAIRHDMMSTVGICKGFLKKNEGVRIRVEGEG